MRDFFVKLIDATDPSASLRHFAFLLVVLAAIVWLSIALSRPLAGSWIEAFGLLLAAVTGAKILGARNGDETKTSGKDNAQ